MFLVIYAAHGRGVYICGCLFTCACGTFRSFHLFTSFLGEFDYTARVKVLHTTGYS